MAFLSPTDSASAAGLKVSKLGMIDALNGGNSKKKLKLISEEYDKAGEFVSKVLSSKVMKKHLVNYLEVGGNVRADYRLTSLNPLEVSGTIRLGSNSDRATMVHEICHAIDITDSEFRDNCIKAVMGAEPKATIVRDMTVSAKGLARERDFIQLNVDAPAEYYGKVYDKESPLEDGLLSEELKTSLSKAETPEAMLKVLSKTVVATEILSMFMMDLRATPMRLMSSHPDLFDNMITLIHGKDLE